MDCMKIKTENGELNITYHSFNNRKLIISSFDYDNGILGDTKIFDCTLQRVTSKKSFVLLFADSLFLDPIKYEEQLRKIYDVYIFEQLNDFLHQFAYNY